MNVCQLVADYETNNGEWNLLSKSALKEIVSEICPENQFPRAKEDMMDKLSEYVDIHCVCTL